MGPRARQMPVSPRLPPPRIAGDGADELSPQLSIATDGGCSMQEQLDGHRPRLVASRRSRGWQPMVQKGAEDNSTWPAVPELPDFGDALTPRLVPPRRVVGSCDVELGGAGRLSALSAALRRPPAAERLGASGPGSGDASLETEGRRELMVWAEALVQKVKELEADVMRLTQENEQLRQAVAGAHGADPGQAEVCLAFSVRNVALSRLHTDADLFKAFKSRLRQAISKDCALNGHADVRLDDVRLDTLAEEASSIRVEAIVAPPASVEASELQEKLSHSQTLARGIANGLEGVSNIRAAREGPIAIQRLSVVCRGRENLRSVLEKHEALQEAYELLQKDFEELQASCTEQSRLRAVAEQCLEEHRDTMTMQLRDVAEDKDRTLKSLDATHGLKEGFAQVVQGLMAVVNELQDKYVAQTRHYEQLAKQVRGNIADHVQDLDSAEDILQDQARFVREVRAHMQAARLHGATTVSELQQTNLERAAHQREAMELLNKNEEAAQRVRLHQQEVAKLQRQEEARLRLETEQAQKKQERLRLQRKILNEPNIARFMALAMEGKLVHKVVGVTPHGSTQKLELRKLKLEIEQGVKGAPPKMWMKWCKEPYKEYSEKSKCDLERVCALGFGQSARAPLLFPNDASIVPERCFSVFNPRRSFDFVCTNESDVEVFMLCLTRLCYRAQGWHVQGSISSHSRFVSSSGWCKLRSSCKAKGRPLGAHILSAMPHERPAKPR